MAKFNNGVIDFDKEDIEAAWENAPHLVNKEKEEYRMCYICKFHMLKENFDKDKLSTYGWIVDLINLKKLDLDHKNFIAIHPWCMEYKKGLDNRSLLKKVKAQLWAFNDSKE
ncbi:hypothetical protein [Spiroplasma tabanidicola]|uniref:HNH endonuclease n=1 Tax=Spiroplasma tabanidicola TaxID=324079 RepID=A0A6I6CBT0_9MOLU|nr:hypothetical protein [Spiroplasma tabanidicola]QGS51668.1 hypothetical protein STABA_v1c03020 [Spiroplasma tabanidicola]